MSVAICLAVISQAGDLSNETSGSGTPAANRLGIERFRHLSQRYGEDLLRDACEAFASLEAPSSSEETVTPAG